MYLLILLDTTYALSQVSVRSITIIWKLTTTKGRPWYIWPQLGDNPKIDLQVRWVEIPSSIFIPDELLCPNDHLSEVLMRTLHIRAPTLTGFMPKYCQGRSPWLLYERH
jgi:hypothetical protein